jgi:hypothetical protein
MEEVETRRVLTKPHMMVVDVEVDVVMTSPSPSSFKHKGKRETLLRETGDWEVSTKLPLLDGGLVGTCHHEGSDMLQHAAPTPLVRRWPRRRVPDAAPREEDEVEHAPCVGVQGQEECRSAGREAATAFPGRESTGVWGGPEAGAEASMGRKGVWSGREPGA